MTDKHTPPIPWQRGQMDIIYSADCSEECVHHTLDHVVAVLSGTDSDAIDLIVRAVNSHELMLEALRKFLEVNGRFNDMLYDKLANADIVAELDGKLDIAAAAAEAAIAAATGEDA